MQEIVKGALEAEAGLGILQEPPQALEGQGKVGGDGPLQGTHQTQGEDLFEVLVRLQEGVGGPTHIVLHGLLEALAAHGPHQPILHRSGQGFPPGRGEDLRHRLVGHALEEVPGPLLREDLEALRLQVALEALDPALHGLVQDALQLRQDLGRDHLPDGAPLPIQDGLEEVGEAVVEGLPELPVGEGPGQILLGEETIAHGPAHGCRQSGLILGDGSLEDPQGSTEEGRGLVRVEEHPDGHRVREPPGQGSEEYGDKGLQKRLGGHQPSR